MSCVLKWKFNSTPYYSLCIEWAPDLWMLDYIRKERPCIFFHDILLLWNISELPLNMSECNIKQKKSRLLEKDERTYLKSWVKYVLKKHFISVCHCLFNVVQKSYYRFRIWHSLGNWTLHCHSKLTSNSFTQVSVL